MAADICIYTNNSFVVEKVTIEGNGLPPTKKANVLSAPEEGDDGDDNDDTKKRQ